MGRFAFPLLFFTLLASHLFWQEAGAQVLYGTMVGTVEDQTGGVIPGATVTITNRATRQTREAVTSEAGSYSFPDVQAGSYDLNITIPGFKTFSKTSILVSINTVVRVNARLEVGEVTEMVTVGAEASALQTDRSDVKMELSERETRDLPLGGYRNFQALFKLVPGITPPGDAHSIAGNPMRSMVMNVNGTSRSNNNTRVDGASTTFLWLPHIIAYVPPVEAIETVNIVTNSYDAEQGLAVGAVANVHLKSGTNEFHGSVFEYHTNSRLRARNFFFLEERLPKNILNQFGGTLGGPIVQDQTFFFVNYEGMRQSENASRFVTVPTADQRKGDFSAAGVRLYDPLTGNPDGSGRKLFPDAVLPESRLSPIALKMVNLLPLPTLPAFTNNRFVSAPLIFNRNNVDVKINWNKSEKASLFGRYSTLDWLVHDSLRLGPAGGFGVATIQPGRGCGTSLSLALPCPTIAKVLTMTPGSNSKPFSRRSFKNGSNFCRIQPCCFAAMSAMTMSLSRILVPAVFSLPKISATSSSSWSTIISYS